MFSTQEPIVGTWFVNMTGQLIRVKLLMFSNNTLHRVLVQYLDGSTKSINHDDWRSLKLNPHLHDVGLTMQLH